jgi:hypothetical protein
MSTREQIIAAFYEVISNVAAGGSPIFAGTQRRFTHWTGVPKGKFPFLTILRPGERHDPALQAKGLPDLVLKVNLVIYTTAGNDKASIPDQKMNAMLDAIDAAFSASENTIASGEAQTLGGLVEWCRPTGEVLTVDGDTEPDGIGMTIIPCEIKCGDFPGVLAI